MPAELPASLQGYLLCVCSQTVHSVKISWRSKYSEEASSSSSSFASWIWRICSARVMWSLFALICLYLFTRNVFQSLHRSPSLPLRPVRIVLVELEVGHQLAVLELQILHRVHEQIHRHHLQHDRQADFPHRRHKIGEREAQGLLPQQVLSTSHSRKRIAQRLQIQRKRKGGNAVLFQPRFLARSSEERTT